MFTGLIEKIAIVENLSINSLGAKLSVKANFSDTKIGDSIATNGVCLTVCDIKNDILSFDIMKQTLNNSNLENLKKGDFVNLERAMSIASRFDGHFVSGHIDCTAKVKSIVQDGFSKKIQFECNSDLIIEKGSIAINGVSLTVSNLFDFGFEVSLIPQTLEKTNLSALKVGDSVNIEYDVIGKYIQKFTTKKESKITLEFLKENGF